MSAMVQLVRRQGSYCDSVFVSKTYCAAEIYWQSYEVYRSDVTVRLHRHVCFENGEQISMTMKEVAVTILLLFS